MNPFEFVALLVLIVTMGKVATALLGPISKALAKRIGQDELQGRPRAGEISAQGARVLEVVEAVEARLERLEERLEFLEELKGSPARPELERKTLGD